MLKTCSECEHCVKLVGSKRFCAEWKEEFSEDDLRTCKHFKKKEEEENGQQEI